MKRREFITLVGGAAAWPMAVWPVAVRAQESAPRIGYIYTGAKAVVASRVEAIINGIRESGFASPAQIEFVVRATDGDPTRITPMTEEIIASKVNVVIVAGPAALRAARAATRDIPIVALDLESDPLAGGIATSLSRPGGNVTGIFMDFPDVTAKCLQMLGETGQGLSRVAIFGIPASVQSNSTLSRKRLHR